MSKRSGLVVAPVAAVVLGLVGCGSSDSSSSGGGGGDFCTNARGVASTFGALTGLTSGANLDAVKSAVRTAAQALDGLDNSAPGDISADTHKLRTALDGASSQVQSAKDLAAAGQAVQAISSSDLTASGDRVDKYVQQKCGFSLNGSSSSGSGSATVSSSTSS